jgi:hypothetical protein
MKKRDNFLLMAFAGTVVLSTSLFAAHDDGAQFPARRGGRVGRFEEAAGAPGVKQELVVKERSLMAPSLCFGSAEMGLEWDSEESARGVAPIAPADAQKEYPDDYALPMPDNAVGYLAWPEHYLVAAEQNQELACYTEQCLWATIPLIYKYLRDYNIDQDKPFVLSQDFLIMVFCKLGTEVFSRELTEYAYGLIAGLAPAAKPQSPHMKKQIFNVWCAARSTTDTFGQKFMDDDFVGAFNEYLADPSTCNKTVTNILASRPYRQLDESAGKNFLLLLKSST